MSEKSNTKYVPVGIIAVYSVLLYTAWTLYHVFILPRLESLGNDILTGLLGDGLIKNLIWTLPALIFIIRYSDRLAVPKEKLLSLKKTHPKYLLIFPAFVVYILIGMFTHKISPSFSVTSGEILTVVFVGITEEIVFRGWLLGALYPYAKPPKTDDDIPWSQYGIIAINAVMFLAIHFPRWAMQGEFITSFTSLGFISIVVLSVIFSLVYIETESLILPVLLHMFWDFMIFWLY